MPTLHTLLGVFASPARTLPAAAAERRVVVPVVAATVASLALAAALVPRIDWERAARDQLEGPEAAQMTPHEREEKVAQARKLGALSGYGGAAAGPVLRALAVALFLWMGFRVAGTRPAFGPALSVAAWGLLPASLGRLLAIPAVVRAEGLVPDALPRLLPWNGAYWLPAGAPPAAAAASTSLDLFGLWSAALLVLGMAAVAGASRARAAAVVGALWLGLSAAGMAAAALAAGPAA
jgi:hypothetical protein